MRLMRKAFVLLMLSGIVCFAVSYTTGDKSFLSVGGMVSSLIGIIGVYIVYKMLWSALGMYLNFILLAVACIGGMYFLSGNTKQNFMTEGQELLANEVPQQNFREENLSLKPIRTLPSENPDEDDDEPAQAAQAIAEAGDAPAADEIGSVMAEGLNNEENDVTTAETMPMQNQTLPVSSQASSSSNGLLNKIAAFFSSDAQDEEQQANRAMYNSINPFDYPSISGHPRVVRGSVLVLNGYNLRLYGIEAPYPNQTCADRHGRSYLCGRKSVLWMQDLIDNREVTCYVLGEVVQGWATAICLVDNGQTDLGAAITKAGWAVAYTKNTDIYVPYEKEAAQNRRGLWGGTFYKPWDWYKMQTRKVKITIQNNKSSDGFWDMF